MKNPYAVAQTKLANLKQRVASGEQLERSAVLSLIDIMHEFIRYAGEREQLRAAGKLPVESNTPQTD